MRLGLAIAGALLVGVATALAGDRIVRHFALHHHPMTPQLSLAAAMGGLFAGGLAMLGTLLLTIPWAGRQPRVPR